MNTAIDDFNEKDRRKHASLFRGLTILLLLCILIGGIFKYLHWPGGIELLFASVPFLGGLCLVQALFRSKESKWKYRYLLISIVLPLLFLLVLYMELKFIPYIAAVYVAGFVISFFIRK